MQLVLQCRDLSVALGDHPILFGVNAAVGQGETVALLGGNGSGKTTLIRALLGLIPHRGGEVRIFQTPSGSFRDWARVGYVPQRTSLQVPTATAGEIVATGRLSRRRWFWPLRSPDRTAISDAFAAVKMSHLVRAPFATMSGGQQQRVLIARALAGKPELMIMDEPMAGLDVTTQEGLADLLGEFKLRGMSMLVVLHELGPLEPLIDRSIVLRAGRVIHDGPLLSASAPNQGDHHDNPRGASALHSPTDRW